MRFIVNSSVLNTAIGVVSKVINSKSPMAILSSILFQKDGEGLSLTAGDGENTIICNIPVAEMDGEVNFAVEGKDIQESLRSLTDMPLVFEVSEAGKNLTISYTNGKFALPTIDSSTYPRLLEVNDDANKIEVESVLLMNALSRTVPATANEELRPVMNGVYFDCSNGLTIVASDGHKLVRNTINNVTIGENVPGFILGKKIANILKGVLSKDSEPVSIQWGSNTAVIMFGNYKIITRLFEGRYPNYKAVIPNNNNNSVVVDRMAMISALKRVLPFANYNSMLVQLDIKDNTITLNSEDFDFNKTATEKLVCSSDCELSIGFKGSVLVELLSMITSEEVKFSLGEPSRAGLIEPLVQEENQDVLMLIMPMLLG